MKRLAALGIALIVSLAAGLPAHAQSPQAHRASGVVKAVNAGKGTVSIAHGPVASLKWPPMTMSFNAEAKLLQDLQPGAKVEFEFFQQGSRYVITSIK